MNGMENFIKRVEAATKAKSKDIRLSLVEAQELSFEMSQLLIRENKLLDQIINLRDDTDLPSLVQDLKKVVQAAKNVDGVPGGSFSMDGGGFKA